MCVSVGGCIMNGVHFFPFESSKHKSVKLTLSYYALQASALPGFHGKLSSDRRYQQTVAEAEECTDVLGHWWVHGFTWPYLSLSHATRERFA